MERPFDFAEIVRASHRAAQAAVLADVPAARKVQDDYAKAVGANRNLVLLDPAGLPAFRPKGSWAMAVVVAPSSGLAALATWARRAGRDADERIRFYLLPNVPIARAFAPWYAARFDDPRTADARNWRALHPSFGLFFANTVYVDAKLRPEWFSTRGGR